MVYTNFTVIRFLSNRPFTQNPGGENTVSPYYKAIHIDYDGETGQMSDEMAVSVSGKL
jgi:hypothetical protein